MQSPMFQADAMSVTAAAKCGRGTVADVGRHARYVLDCRRVLSGPNVETL